MKSVWPVFYSFDPEMVLHFHFTFKPFPGHAQKRERARERKSSAISHSHRSSSLRVTPSSPHLRSFTVVRSLSQTQTHSREAPCRSWLRKAPRRPQSCLHADHDLAKHRADRSPSLNLIASLSSFFSQFDQIWWFFFLGFVYVSVLRNEWYYIFVWQPRKCEKMWATNRKCVFYGIFKNTTKYQKIFLETFFEMQPIT